MEIFSKSFKMKNKSFLTVQERLVLVEATGLEPTTFWSLRHNRKFFIYFPSISKSFVSATDAFLYFCSHCFHVVQIRKWSKVWSKTNSRKKLTLKNKNAASMSLLSYQKKNRSVYIRFFNNRYHRWQI